MRELVEFIVRRLVAHPDQVEVRQTEEGDTVRLELRVAQDDLGKVIGRQGRTAKAMRSVLALALERQGKRSRLEIVE